MFLTFFVLEQVFQNLNLSIGIGNTLKSLLFKFVGRGIYVAVVNCPGIVLVAMVPTLSIAAIISRNLYKRTGNIWTPACLNALLMTTMAVANTMVAFK